MTAPALRDLIASLPDFQPDDMPVAQTQELMARYVIPIAECETVPLKEALGRVLASDVMSPIDVPAHDNSAMDGYAFAGSALGDSPLVLQVVGKAFAGHRHAGAVGAGECVRIMTGAVMPDGCDTVIPQELVGAADAGTNANTVTIAPGTVKAGDNRRLRGEDLTAGKAALTAERVLRAADVGLLASLGIGQLTVKRRLRVAYFSTGDELRSLGETLDEGCVYDSNRYTMGAMLARLGCEVLDMGVVWDDPAALEAALRSAAIAADAIITSGGAASGDADHTAQVMARLGDVAFWKLAMRPGRPLTFGRIGHGESAGDGSGNAWLFGLPGNPVAAMISFYFLARPALLHMMGARDDAPPAMRAVAQAAIRKRPGRTEYQRGILSRDEHGQTLVRITGAQGSGILRSMSEANCIVVLTHDQGNVNVGELVDVVLLDALTP